MAEVLLINPSEMTSETILGGNVDVDKYAFCIADTQVSLIEPLLGTELYDKMIADYAVPLTYTGDYLELYNDYINPILKHHAVASYIEIAGVMLSNGGLFKHAPENSQIVDKEETFVLSGKYRNLAQMYVLRFDKWIINNPLTEYKTNQDEVDASKSINDSAGFWFGDTNENTDPFYG